jgi:hypothetical protein
VNLVALRAFLVPNPGLALRSGFLRVARDTGTIGQSALHPVKARRSSV